MKQKLKNHMYVFLLSMHFQTTAQTSDSTWTSDSVLPLYFFFFFNLILYPTDAN